MSKFLRFRRSLVLALIILSIFVPSVGFYNTNAEAAATTGEFKTVLLWPKAAVWSTETDATARRSGSNSMIEVEPSSSDPGVTFLGSLGRIQGETGPVGFVRAITDVDVDASDFDSIAVSLGAESSELVMTVLLQDKSQTNTSEWFEADIIQPRGIRKGVGLIGSGFSLIRFANFKRVVRGKIVDGPTIDSATIRRFGVQIARSKQKASLRNGGDIPFRLVLAALVPAINTNSESIKPEIVKAAVLEYEQNVLGRASETLDPRELLAIKTASDQLYNRFFPRALSVLDLDQVYASPIVNNTVRVNIFEPSGRPAPEAPSELDSQQRLNTIADIRSIAMVPEASNVWLRAVLVEFAITTRPKSIINSAGDLRLNRDDFRSFLDSKLRTLGFKTRIKRSVIQSSEDNLGLSAALIDEIRTSVVFDQSPFSDRVGEFSFPMLALYYGSVLAAVPESERLSTQPFPTFFRQITAQALANQFRGWRLWQRIFANQSVEVAGTTNSIEWWRDLMNGVLSDK